MTMLIGLLNENTKNINLFSLPRIPPNAPAHLYFYILFIVIM